MRIEGEGIYGIVYLNVIRILGYTDEGVGAVIEGYIVSELRGIALIVARYDILLIARHSRVHDVELYREDTVSRNDATGMQTV